MPVERTQGGTSLIDVLDRVLDKGIVIDAWVRVSLVGIEILSIDARVVVASVDTYLRYAHAIDQLGRGEPRAELPGQAPARPALPAAAPSLRTARARQPRETRA